MENAASIPDAVITPRPSDLGNGFMVKRALPSAIRRSVGPFVFLDQMGPAGLGPGEGLDVPPHPHIGLATVTYLFEGELLHRDSLGTVQAIRPHEVNWMTAGRGIVHSERTPDAARAGSTTLSGIQCWVALPSRDEEMEPAFAHHAADELPVLEADGMALRVIAGEVRGARSPVATRSPLFYADLLLEAGAAFRLDADHSERAAYLVDGELALPGSDDVHGAGSLLVFREGGAPVLRAVSKTRLMLLGGEPLDGHRFIWWNFVSSSRQRIEQAKADWREGRFARVPGETERIPLPERKPPPVKYP